LTAAATTGPEWGLSWTYDGFGNRLAQTVTKGSAPAASVTVNPATNRVVGLGYDSNGSQTSWTTPLGPVTASYDVDNRLASISTPNGSEVYAYSSANQRLRKQGKLYFYGVSGELLVNYDFAYGGSGTTPLNPKTLVYFGGMLVFGEVDRRLTMDRLGSTVRTEGYFQPEYRYRYYPYGEQQGGSSNEDQVKFGTYWRDSVSGLDYAQSRYFAASQGRFTSANPYVMSGGMADSQGWNRFTYTRGDPVNRTDRLGLQDEPALYFSIIVPATADPIFGNSSGNRSAWGTEGRDHSEAWTGDGESSVFGGDARAWSFSIEAALSRAEKALERPACQSIFGDARTRSGSWDPKNILNTVFSAGGGYMGDSRTYAGYQTLSWYPFRSIAATSPTFFVGGNAGYGTVGWRVEINLTKMEEFWQIDPDYVAGALLHEMGHIYALVAGSGGSLIKYNGFGSSGQSEANQTLVMKNCFR
jgi:RHS repeat-associated protein